VVVARLVPSARCTSWRGGPDRGGGAGVDDDVVAEWREQDRVVGLGPLEHTFGQRCRAYARCGSSPTRVMGPGSRAPFSASTTVTPASDAPTITTPCRRGVTRLTPPSLRPRRAGAGRCPYPLFDVRGDLGHEICRLPSSSIRKTSGATPRRIRTRRNELPRTRPSCRSLLFVGLFAPQAPIAGGVPHRDLGGTDGLGQITDVTTDSPRSVVQAAAL